MHYISGLNVDDELSWKDHVDQVATKISKMTVIMVKARHYPMIYPNVIKDNLQYSKTPRIRTWIFAS